MLCSLYFPAWFLYRNPRKRVMICSYSDDYAAEWGAKVRNLFKINEDLLHIRVSDTSKAADRWDIANSPGGVKTAGVGGQITGRGAHLMVVDDPFKDAEEADSPTIREKRWTWWNSTAQSRLRDGAVVVLIQTRWHDDDLAGRVIAHEPEKWEILNLPALAEEDDDLGRDVGEVLCPELFPPAEMLLKKESMITRAWTALYQQRPTPEGGGAFKEANFQYWSQQNDEGFIYRLDDKKEGIILVPQDSCWRLITADLAATARTSSDYTVASVWDVAAYLEPSRLILRHVERLQIEGAEHVDLFERLWHEWGPSFIGIEEAMQGTQTIDLLRRKGIAVIGLKHRSKDKEFRAKDAELMSEMRRVYWPRASARYPWVADWERELLLFPAAKHDDQVDTFSYAAQEVLRGVNMTRRPKPKDPETLSDRAWAQVERRQKRSRYHPVLGRLPR